MSKRIRGLDRSSGGSNPPSPRCAHRPPSRHEEEWRDWANLPRELVEDIAGRLLRYDVAEYIRLRAACTEWRKCTADPRERALDRRFRPRRWIMLSNRTDGDGRRFLNLGTGSCVRVDLPELSRHHLEASAEGLLLLRDKATHAVRLLNPLTRALTYLPPITGGARIVWTEPFESTYRIVHAGISDETSPASVVLVMTDRAVRSSSVSYAAKPGDERWAVIDDWARRSWHSFVTQGRRMPRGHRYSSVSTLQRRVYVCTPEGNILKVTLRPKPRLVPVVVNQPLNECNNVVSYLVPPPDDEDDDGGMLMVRYYRDLWHLSADEQRKMKRRRDVIKVPTRWSPRSYDWQLIQVFELDELAARNTQLVPVEDVGRDRAVFVGEVACFSVSASTFPCVAGNAVYPGAAGVCCPPVGVRYLADKSMDPPFQFTTDNETLPRALIEGTPLKGRPELNLVPVARPCTLQEYLSCCSGLKGGLKD